MLDSMRLKHLFKLLLVPAKMQDGVADHYVKGLIGIRKLFNLAPLKITGGQIGGQFGGPVVRSALIGRGDRRSSEFPSA